MYSLKKWQPVLHTQVLGTCINLEFQWQEAPAVCNATLQSLNMPNSCNL